MRRCNCEEDVRGRPTSPSGQRGEQHYRSRPIRRSTWLRCRHVRRAWGDRTGAGLDAARCYSAQRPPACQHLSYNMQRLSRAAFRIHTSGIQKRNMAVHNVAVAGFGEGTNELVSGLIRLVAATLRSTLRPAHCSYRLRLLFCSSAGAAVFRECCALSDTTSIVRLTAVRPRASFVPSLCPAVH